MADIQKEKPPLASYNHQTGVVTVNRGILVNTIIKCKQAAMAAKPSEYEITEEGNEVYKIVEDGFLYTKTIRGDYQYGVDELISVKVTFPGQEGRTESKTIPIWNTRAGGCGALRDGDPDWGEVVNVLHEALAKPPTDFPCRGPIAPDGIESVRYPGFVYYNQLLRNSSSRDFSAEGRVEIHYNDPYRSRPLLRETWVEGLVETEKGSVVLEGEMPGESTTQ